MKLIVAVEGMVEHPGFCDCPLNRISITCHMLVQLTQNCSSTTDQNQSHPLVQTQQTLGVRLGVSKHSNQSAACSDLCHCLISACEQHCLSLELNNLTIVSIRHVWLSSNGPHCPCLRGQCRSDVDASQPYLSHLVSSKLFPSSTYNFKTFNV